MVARVVTGLVGLALAGTVSAQAPVRTFMWRVVAEGAPPLHVLGSLHVLSPDYYPLPRHVDEAFAASSVLIEEADLDELADPSVLMGLLSRAMLTDGQTLEQAIAPALHAQVMARADKLGLPRAGLQRLKPWLVGLSLTQPAIEAAGFKAEHGVDRHYFDRAKALGKTRRALETAAFQFDRLDQLSAVEQEAMLRSTLEELDTQLGNVKSIATAWARGDVATLESLLLSSRTETPDLYRRLIVERNAAWVAPLARCFAEKTACFVVVGAAHLVGPDSLLLMLEKKGYKVAQQ